MIFQNLRYVLYFTLILINGNPASQYLLVLWFRSIELLTHLSWSGMQAVHTSGKVLALLIPERWIGFLTYNERSRLTIHWPEDYNN